MELTKPGGEIAIDVYPLRLTALLHWKYILRPVTRHMKPERLYHLIARWTPPLPIVQCEHWGLPPEINREWAVLDTFDTYSPAYDRP